MAAEDLCLENSNGVMEIIKVPASLVQDASSGIDFSKVIMCLKTQLLVAFCPKENILLIFKHV